jgi:DNA-binding MarR family transcriptional regulator
MADGITDDARKRLGLMADLYGAIIKGMNKRGLKSPPVTLIEAFLAVCIEEGLSVQEYAKRAKIPVTTMSRHLLDLGDRNRKMKPGLGLVTSRTNPLNRRQREYMLTERGRSLLGKMTLVMQRIEGAHP